MQNLDIKDRIKSQSDVEKLDVSKLILKYKLLIILYGLDENILGQHSILVKKCRIVAKFLY